MSHPGTMGTLHRARGLATSTNGLNWTKYAGNPILTHDPDQNHMNVQENSIWSVESLWKDVTQTLYDLNATVLHLMGFDHERLTYYHNGFERRLTDVHGHVINDILA